MTPAKRWNVAITINGRTKGPFAAIAAQPWTAIQNAIRFGVLSKQMPGLQDIDEMTVTVVPAKEAK